MSNRPFPLFCLTLLSTFALTNCGSSETAKSGAPAQASNGKVKAGGATLPLMAYSEWPDALKKEEPGLAMSYEAVGSGEGIKQFQAGQLDVAATDMPVPEEELAKNPLKPVHLPTLISGVVPVYNLPGLKGDVKFTGEALAGIFSGKIKTWNHPLLAKSNEGVELPAAPVVVLHRSEASGTTYVFTHYLSKVSAEFKSAVGEGLEVKWPASKGVVGSMAMAEAVKATANSIGYADLNFAEKAGSSIGLVQNAAGKYVKASLESIGAAADSVPAVPDDFRMDITNASGANAYPIATYTYLLVPTQIEDVAQRTKIRRFLQWVYQSGEKMAMQLDYGILPPPVLRKVEARVDRIR